MQLSLTRDEIIRMVRSYLGMQTSAGLSSQVDEQHIAIVNSAALIVQAECRWVSTRKRITVNLGAEQSLVSYPAGCTAGSITGIAVYDSGAYYELEQTLIPLRADVDQEEAEAGAAFDAVQGRPAYYQQAAQIYLSPPSDQAYPLRIEYNQSAELLGGASKSLYDAQLIAYQATSAIAMQRGDEKLAEYYARLYSQRMMKLRAAQSAGTRFALDSQADLGEGEGGLGPVPNWDVRPVSRPGAST